MRKVEGIQVNDFETTFSGTEVGLIFFETSASEIKDAGFMGETDKEVIDNFIDYIMDDDFRDSIVAYDRIRGKNLMGWDFSDVDSIDGLIVDRRKIML